MHHFKNRAAILLSAAAFVVAAPAWAQEEDASEVVVTAQRENRTEVIRSGNLGVLGDKPAADVPFAIKSYSDKLILNQQPQSLGQVLENDPSVRTTYGFGNAAEVFVVRGFPLFGEDIALDGLYGLVPRQLVAPELYDQVQVLNGANAFLNGAAPSGSGIGGSVNLMPKRAGANPLNRVTLNYTGTAHFGGSFDFSRRSADGALGIRINGAAREGDVAVDDEFRSAYVIGAGFDWRSERARVSLDLAYQRVKIRQLRPKVTLGGNFIPDVPAADANYAQPWTYTTLRDVFGMVRGEYDLADDVMIYAAFGARDGAEEGIYDSVTVNDPVTGAASGNGLYVPRTDNNEAATIGLRAKFAGFGMTHEVNFGGSALWQVNRNAYDFLYGPGFAGFATNLYDTPVVPLPTSSLVGGDLDDPFPISRTRLASVYASDTLGFAGDRVLLTLGLRLQTLRVTGYSYADGSVATDYDESATTPVLGLVVKPADGVSLYANRIEGLAQGPTAPIDANLVNSGEVFAPYKSTQYEVGGKVALGRFNASLALFQTEQPNAYARPVDPANPAGRQIYAIDGKQRNRGVELSLDGELAEGLRLIGGASLIEAKQRQTAGGLNEGKDAPGVPGYMVNANLEWDVPFVPGATLTGRVVHTGEQQVNADNSLKLPDWTRFDLGARFVTAVAAKPLTLRLNVDNVANARYWASAFNSFGTALLQGTPRTLKLSASIDF